MFQRSQCRSIIVDAESLPQLDALLDGENGKLLLVPPDLEDPRCHRERWPQHIFWLRRSRGVRCLARSDIGWGRNCLSAFHVGQHGRAERSHGCAPECHFLRQLHLPFETYKTFRPYLVGDYETVSNELALYVVAGYETFILDIPASQEELSHTSEVFKLAAKKASARKPPSAHLTSQAV